MTRIANAGLAVLFLALAASACIPRVREPAVRLVGVRVAGLGLQGGLIYVRVGVANPNEFALSASGLSYDIEISDPGADDRGWTKLAEGRFDQPVQVGPEDSTVVEIPVAFQYSGLGGAVRSLLSTGTFDYRIRGIVDVESPVRTGVPYTHEGTITLSELD